MSSLPVTLLVVAKAPEPGRAKTRLAATVGDRVAADIAAAALLDTLTAAAAAPVAARVVALTGDLGDAAGATEIRQRLESFTVIEQRGDGFGDRLANAHADASRPPGGFPVLQIGMDTPQVTAELLAGCAGRLLETPALLGLAFDGGWWVLGVRTPAIAECLRAVPDVPARHRRTHAKSVARQRYRRGSVQPLADVDVVDDVAVVREACGPASRFARVTRAAGL